MNILGVNPNTGLAYIEIPKKTSGYGSQTLNTEEVKADFTNISEWYVSHPDMQYTYDVTNGSIIIERGKDRLDWAIDTEEANNISSNLPHLIKANPIIQSYNANVLQCIQREFSSTIIKPVDELTTLRDCDLGVANLLDLVNDVLLVNGAVQDYSKVDVILEALGSMYTLYKAKRRVLQLLADKGE